MRSDEVEPVATAQREPDDDYIVWAEIEVDAATAQIPLQTVRLPQGVAVQEVGGRIAGHAQRVMRANGHDDAAIGGAEIFIAPLPTAHDAKKILDRHLTNGDALVLIDLAFWEVCRRRLHLKAPAARNGAEAEMDYCGL